MKITLTISINNDMRAAMNAHLGRAGLAGKREAQKLCAALLDGDLATILDDWEHLPHTSEAA